MLLQAQSPYSQMFKVQDRLLTHRPPFFAQAITTFRGRPATRVSSQLEYPWPITRAAPTNSYSKSLNLSCVASRCRELGSAARLQFETGSKEVELRCLFWGDVFSHGRDISRLWDEEVVSVIICTSVNASTCVWSEES